MGARDQKVTFWRKGEAGRDAFNSPIPEWSEIGAAFADRRDLSDDEKTASDVMVTATLARFRVRSNALTRSLTSLDRLRTGDGREWDITGVKDAVRGRNRLIEIRAEIQSDDMGAIVDANEV